MQRVLPPALRKFEQITGHMQLFISRCVASVASVCPRARPQTCPLAFINTPVREWCFIFSCRSSISSLLRQSSLQTKSAVTVRPSTA